MGKEFLFNEKNPFHANIQWYSKYIDDLLLMWKGPISIISDFLLYLNNKCRNLKFTSHVEKEQIEYLDVCVKGSDTGGVVITPYCKSTAGNSILCATSCHPRLRQREYPEWTLQRAKEVVSLIPQDSLLSKEKSDNTTRDTSQPVVFSTQYNPHWKKVTNIIKKHLPMLNHDENFSSILLPGVKYVSRKAPTLGTNLLPSLFSSRSESPSTWLNVKGNYLCGHNSVHTLLPKTYLRVQQMAVHIKSTIT